MCRRNDNRSTLAGTYLIAWLTLCAFASADFTIGQNFTASTFGIHSTYYPPNANGAVGSDYFVELINGSYAVYRKSDGAAVQRTSLINFWQNAGVTPNQRAYDPRVVYDAPSGRWFAVSLDNNQRANSFLVAVSNSSDPTAGWKAFSVPVSSQTNRYADYTTLGVDSKGVYIGANMYSLGNAPIGVDVLAIPKADLLSTTPTVANSTLFDSKSIGQLGSTPQPIVNLNANDSGNAGIISAYGDSQLKRTDVVFSGNTASLAPPATPIVNLPSMTGPPNLTQPNGVTPIYGGDNRLSSSIVQQGGNIWGVQSVTSNGLAAIRWFRIDASTNTLEESGLITDPTKSFAYGSIAVNAYGDVVIGFTGVDESTYASAYAVGGKLSGSTTTFGTVQLLKAGTATYSVVDPTGRNRWGDESSITIDPTDPSRFWTIQEIASAPDTWSTQVTEIIVSNAAGSVVPEPAGWTLLGLGLTLVWRRKRLG